MEKIFEKINSIIKEYDSIILMGHKDPDLDSLGSCLGLYEIVESFNKKAYLFINYSHLEDYNTNINQAFIKMQKNVVCVNEKSYKNIPGKKLVIVVDVHSKDRLEYSTILDEYDSIVLDHHIKNKNYIKNAKFFYIDSTLSSMCEMITYYVNYLNIKIDDVIASILLAGIEIDTNGYNLKTTERTYQAASILIKLGADTILKQELLKETKEDYIKRATFIRNSFMITDSIAMCIISGITSSLELAQTAEELLNFEDVEASFVLGKIDNNLISVSGRSLGKIDVSKVINKLGGGGHSSNAAAQIRNKNLKEVQKKIIEVIGEFWRE